MLKAKVMEVLSLLIMWLNKLASLLCASILSGVCTVRRYCSHRMLWTRALCGHTFHPAVLHGVSIFHAFRIPGQLKGKGKGLAHRDISLHVRDIQKFEQQAGLSAVDNPAESSEQQAQARLEDKPKFLHIRPILALLCMAVFLL